MRKLAHANLERYFFQHRHGLAKTMLFGVVCVNVSQAEQYGVQEATPMPETTQIARRNQRTTDRILR